MQLNPKQIFFYLYTFSNDSIKELVSYVKTLPGSDTFTLFYISQSLFPSFSWKLTGIYFIPFGSRRQRCYISFFDIYPYNIFCSLCKLSHFLTISRCYPNSSVGIPTLFSTLFSGYSHIFSRSSWHRVKWCQRKEKNRENVQGDHVISHDDSLAVYPLPMLLR